MMIETGTSLQDYTMRLQSLGRVTFTSKDALEALGVKQSAFQKAAARLQKKQLLLNPRQGFYVAVPPQYLQWGAPPPNWYIDDLMRHEGRPYYVGLLKAAELHGATHHAVMEFQVVTDKQLAKIRAGRSFITFYFRKDMQAVSDGTEDRKTDTGKMKISSAELTALDLLRYLHAIGGIDTASTVLKDLAPRLDGAKLAALAHDFERTTIQRLGYLLDWLDFEAATQDLHQLLTSKAPFPWVSLEPYNKQHGGEPPVKNARWHIVNYREPEIDE